MFKVRIMVELINFKVQIDLTDFTLIIPSVSVGNVGQLTVDLLISTHGFKRYATIWHPAIIPCVGTDPFANRSADVCTASELYANENLKVAVIQFRSIVEPKFSKIFHEALREEIKKLQFKNVVLLTSTYSYERHDIESPEFRYIGDKNVMELCEINVQEMKLPGVDNHVIEGTGYAFFLYNMLKDLIPCVVFLKYTSEGDNRPDAIRTLEFLTKCLRKLRQSKIMVLKFPPSWEYIFGNPPPIGIY